jgi:thioredoxin reductase (NADPH)
VVIIGSGPAGWSAAIYAARAELSPVVYEGNIGKPELLPLGQLALTTEVENYAGFPAGDLAGFIRTAVDEKRQAYFPIEEERHAVTGPELMNLMRQQALNFGTRAITDEIVSIDLSKRPFTLKPESGDQIEAHTIIIATGARANYLGLESEERFKNRGVSACAVCDGALPRFRDRPLVVVGGGDSAVEEASYLTKFGSVVYMVHRRDQLRASRIMQERAFENEKLEVLWNTVVEEVLGDDENGLTGVRLRSTKDDSLTDYEAGGMFVAIGHTPNTSFLDGQVATNDKGYVVWQKSFRTNTSVEGVFAAGDVADDHYRQAITSAGTGCMAALDAEHYLVERGL